MIKRYPAILGVALATAVVPATAQSPSPTAQAWAVEHTGSAINFAGVAEGSAFEGTFGNWEADIAFDPEHLDWSGVTVTIDLTSADSGNPDRDMPLQDNDWFATALHPNATFKADSITSDGSGGYVAEGELTIRDITRPVSLPFTLAIEGDTAMMQGSVTINRQDFKIGTGTWQDRSVGNEVTINVSVTATKAS
ncbi:MAG TPA: YceI family protein [Sphingomonadaceae bacterium]|nr:YceI family protein [Sphingomonadaceae bacterium]